MIVRAAILPARDPEVFGTTPKPEHFRFSFGKRHFVLNEKSGVKPPARGDEDTVGMGEPGIMQQVGLENIEHLQEEMSFLAERYPKEYERVAGLMTKLWERRSLGGHDLEQLREDLGTYAMKRPRGMVTEVRNAHRSRGSFWPHHHPEGIWYRHERGFIGADEDGIFFLTGEGLEYFRSLEFKQERVDRFKYRLTDMASGRTVDSDICVCDCWYDGEYDDEPPPELHSGMLAQVVYSRFNFRESVAKLILQLHTMAKLGVIIGQPILIAEEDIKLPESRDNAEDTLPC
jgi:hypothetical protein